jgi:poly-gamma-glutamate synthesis protein (capsule biosynthesis protein)
VFLGDLSLGRTVEKQLARAGTRVPWEGLELLLQNADLTAANLESVLTTQGEPWKKRYLIRAHPQRAVTLVEAGIDLVTLANNHILDYEQVGLEETLDSLDALGIRAVGVSRVGEDPPRPVTVDLNGLRVAVLGYAASRWFASSDMPATDRVAWAQPSAVAADVHAVREQVDFVVVLLHAGTEYASEPSPDQVAVARAATAAGADLVVGHHPHVTQSVEENQGGLIVYSLGDALFDIPRPEAMQGDLLRVHITAAGLAQAELWPFWIDWAIQPRLLDDGQGNPQFEIVYP